MHRKALTLEQECDYEKKALLQDYLQNRLIIALHAVVSELFNKTQKRERLLFGISTVPSGLPPKESPFH